MSFDDFSKDVIPTIITLDKYGKNELTGQCLGEIIYHDIDLGVIYSLYITQRCDAYNTILMLENLFTSYTVYKNTKHTTYYICVTMDLYIITAHDLLQMSFNKKIFNRI